MTRATGRVWYAAYGSNLHWPRLRCYLEGGRAQGSCRVHVPASDRRRPRVSLPARLPFPLFFAGASPTWGGGTAFVDPERRDAVTLARLYLVSEEQFGAIVAAEGHRSRVRLPRGTAGRPRWYRVAPGAYGTVVHAGQRDGRPVLTVTGPPPGARLAAPRPAYVRTIAAGLAWTHGLRPDAIVDYLTGVAGVAGTCGRAQLLAATTALPVGTAGAAAHR